MSLVICSNNTDEGGGQLSSIYKPWSFRNDLSSNVEFPADCQVALQSAKINMDGTIMLGDRSARTFYWYFGKVPLFSGGAASPYYATDAGQTTSGVVKVHLFAETEGKVQTDIQGLADELRIALNRACFHPNLHNRIFIDPRFDPTTQQFTGFNFTFGEQITVGAFAPANSINGMPAYATTARIIDGLWGAQRKYQETAGLEGRAPPYGVGRNVLLATDMGFTMTAVPENSPQSVVLNVPPLNLKGGMAAFHLDGVIGFGVSECRFACGLTRPALDTDEVGLGNGLILPEWYKLQNGASQPPWVNYYDYCVTCNMLNDDRPGDGTKDFLRLFHTVRNADDTGGHRLSTSEPWKQLLKFMKIPYGDGTGGSSNTGCDPLVVASTNFSAVHGYNMSDNSLNITGVLFQVDGQRVKVQLYDNNLSVAHTKYTIAEYDAARVKGLNLKPVGQPEWCLLPQFTIANAGAVAGTQSGIFERFDGVDNIWPEFDMEADGSVDNVNRGTTSWNLTKMGAGRGAMIRQQVQEIQQRFQYDYSIAGGSGGVTTYLYDAMATGPAFNFARQKQVLVLQGQGGQEGWNRFPRAFVANATRLLGFKDRGIVDFSALNVVHDFVLASPSVPEILPTSSIFVRLHGFNQESTNAKARGKSDIIAHLPRFDGLNSVGPLYLEPANMVYLDLNNPAPIKMNAFDLSLCHSNEQYATGLCGTTIIVLHFREKPK